jgi:hypothetical protein
VSRFAILIAVFMASVSVASAAPVRTWVSVSTSSTSRVGGLHIDRPSSERTPNGISLDVEGTPVWDMGIDFEFPDLILAYSHITQSDQFRLRAETGQLEIGPRVGHPVTDSQVNITSGTEDAPLDGVGVGCYGNCSGLNLYQRLPRSRRTKVNFQSLYQVGTDSTQGNTPDFWVFNNQTGRFPFWVNPRDRVTMGAGATISQTVQHTGAAVGFFGARPIARPSVIGSLSNGTALASLLARLSAMGLIVDATTP